VINLGDIIDGKAGQNASEQLESVLQEFGRFKGGPVYHLVGNHCLYNLSRAQLHPKLGLGQVAYYDVIPHDKYRFVMVDPYDISVAGWPPGHPNRSAAEHILKQHNPNKDLNSSAGMHGRLKRFVAFNGALGAEQIKWLESVLEDATSKGQNVVICTHVPFYPLDITPIVWNAEEVMAIIARYKCVKLVLAGHNHEGDYLHHHVHHYTFKAVVECRPCTNAFCRMDVYEDRILMKGFGGLECMEFRFGEEEK